MCLILRKCSLFNESDANEDKRLALDELKEMVTTKFGSVKLDSDTMVDILMYNLDKNNDNQLQEDEFVQGFADFIAQCTEVITINLLMH